MMINELKQNNDYEFECNITREDIDFEDYDEWGCAFLRMGKGDDFGYGVELNICYDDGENESAIYRMYEDEAGYIETDSSDFIHLDMDWNVDNWKEILENKMCEAYIMLIGNQREKKLNRLLADFNRKLSKAQDAKHAVLKFLEASYNADLDSIDDLDDWCYAINMDYVKELIHGNN